MCVGLEEGIKSKKRKKRGIGGRWMSMYMGFCDRMREKGDGKGGLDNLADISV